MNLLFFYQELEKKYGRSRGQWKLWCRREKSEKEREEVVIGAVLTQRTSWKNVEFCLANLKKAKMNSLRKISKAGVAKITPLIRPCGFYKTKAFYLLGLAKFIVENYQTIKKMKKERTEVLRERLLEQRGIGPETADSILLYALDKPVFVIDEYTKRFVKKKNLKRQGFSYSSLQRFFEKNLAKNFRLYQDFHSLIVIDGQKTPKKSSS